MAQRKNYEGIDEKLGFEFNGTPQIAAITRGGKRLFLSPESSSYSNILEFCNNFYHKNLSLPEFPDSLRSLSISDFPVFTPNPKSFVPSLNVTEFHYAYNQLPELNFCLLISTRGLLFLFVLVRNHSFIRVCLN